MKKFALSFLFLVPFFGFSVNATAVSLSLFQDGFSLLDKLMLCGLGLVLVGIACLVIAYLKPKSKKEASINSPFDVYMEDDSQDENLPSEEIDQMENPADFREDSNVFSEPETSEASVDAPIEDILPPEEVIETTEEQISETEDSAETDNVVYPKLILTNPATSDFIIIPLYPVTTVGRKTENDLVLNDITASGLHCRILNENGNIYIVDENSTNGTFINGERLTEKTQIHHGDVLAIGKKEYQVSINE